jgi:3-phenylpropionate/trans-cinnamate dioxygenase subunit alpha
MTSTTDPAPAAGTCPGGACGTVATGRATQGPSGALQRPPELRRDVDVSGLVDDEGGLLDRAVFTDEQLYRQELRRVFAPSWLFLAHADQFHKPGDFFTTYMGEDPVIVTMTKNREIKAYLNSCRHRGARAPTFRSVLRHRSPPLCENRQRAGALGRCGDAPMREGCAP